MLGLIHSGCQRRLHLNLAVPGVLSQRGCLSGHNLIQSFFKTFSSPFIDSLTLEA